MRRGFLCRAAGRYAARVRKTMRAGPGGPLGFLGRRAADRAPNVVQCALWGCFTDDLVAVRYVMYPLPYLRFKGVAVFSASEVCEQALVCRGHASSLLYLDLLLPTVCTVVRGMSILGSSP